MVPDWLSLVDVAFLGVALLFALGGFQKGFASQIAHILAFVALGVALFFLYPSLFSHMGRLFRNLNETYMMWMILAGLGVLTVIFFIYTTKLLANVLKTQISDRSDRTYGFILGFVRGALMALLAMVFIVILGPPRFYEQFSAKSKVGRLVCTEMVPRIQPHMTPSVLQERVNKWREALIYQEEGGKLD